MPAVPEPRRVYRTIPARAIDADVVKVVRRLRRFDYEVYLVGGCVRDLLLDVHPKDFDVATAARPRDVRRIFRNSRVIGRRFQLVHVLFGERKVIEVATFRQQPDTGEDDGELLITDDNVFGTAADDAFRRDFTINALFYDVHTREIVDFVGGLSDIEARLVRCIGDPDVRLREDPVRMLRAVKFASRLDLAIEPALWDAIGRHAPEIEKAAPPRLVEEIFRLFRPGVSAAAFRLLRDCGLFGLLLPQVGRWLTGDPDGPGGAAGGAERASRYEALLSAMDAVWAARGVEPPEAMILATLLQPAWQAALAADQAAADAAGRRLDLGAHIQDFLAPLATGMRVPRRIQDRIRLVWMAQARFDGGRRRRQDSFVRRRFFAEAVDFLEVLTRAAGAPLAAVEAWRRRAGLAPLPGARRDAAPDDDPAGDPAPPPPDADAGAAERPARRGRRRRGGRGRGRGRRQPAAPG